MEIEEPREASQGEPRDTINGNAKWLAEQVNRVVVLLLFGRRPSEDDSTEVNTRKVILSVVKILECPRAQRELLLAEIVSATERLPIPTDEDTITTITAHEARFVALVRALKERDRLQGK